MAASLDGVITTGHERCNAGATDGSHDFALLAPGDGESMGHGRHGWGAAHRGIVSAMSTGERVAALKSNPVFAGLPAKELEALAGATREDTSRAREYVFMEGDPARWLCVVASGRVNKEMALTIGRDGARTKAGLALPFHLTRQSLADMTGTTVETAIRSVSRWLKAGLVIDEAGASSSSTRRRLPRSLRASRTADTP